MLRSALSLVVLSMLLVVATSASAASLTAPTSPFAPTHRFVRLDLSGKKPALVITAATAKKYRGHWATYDCENTPDPGRATYTGGGGTVRIRRGERLSVGRTEDYCVFRLKLRSKHKDEVVTHTLHQSVGITAAGRTFVARVEGAVRLDLAVDTAYFGYRTAFATPDRIVKGLPASWGVVAMKTATQTVPAGHLGVWTDGARHMRGVYALADGTQLFYDQDLATHVTTTNVETELQQLRGSHSPFLDSTSGTSTTSSAGR